MKRLYFTVCLTVLCNWICGQRNFTLDECMQYAVEQNLKIKDSEIELAVSRNEYVTAVGGLLPVVTAGTGFGKRFGRSVDPVTNSYTMADFLEGNMNLNIGMALFEGFTRINRMSFQRLNKQISELTVDCRKNEVAFEVMDAFYQVVFEERLQELMVEQRKLSEQYFRQTERFVELGMKAETDLQEMKARVRADIYQETFRKNSHRMALLKLKQLLNLTGEDSLAICYDSREIPIIADRLKAAEVYEISQQTLPQFRMMELQQKTSRKSLALAAGKLSPVLRGEFAVYSGYYDTERDEAGRVISFATQLKSNVNKYVGLTLSIPILNGLQGYTGIRRERWKMKQMDDNVRIQKQNLYVEIESACLALQAAVEEWRQATEQEQAEKLALQQAQRKWEEGLLSAFEWMEIRNRSVSAKAEVARTRLQYDMKLKTVAFFRGEPLYGVAKNSRNGASG